MGRRLFRSSAITIVTSTIITTFSMIISIIIAIATNRRSRLQQQSGLAGTDSERSSFGVDVIEQLGDFQASTRVKSVKKKRMKIGDM